jgi:hypothetical protein
VPKFILLRIVTDEGGRRAMALKYNNDQHHEYLDMIDRVGREWLGVFEGDTAFYSAAYWDLLTRMWKDHAPVMKTDALGFITGVKSPHTAGKFIDTAIRQGLLVETANPQDARSKLVALAPHMRERLDGFFDRAVSEVRRSNRHLDIKGPSPEAP